MGCHCRRHRLLACGLGYAAVNSRLERNKEEEEYGDGEGGVHDHSRDRGVGARLSCVLSCDVCFLLFDICFLSFDICFLSFDVCVLSFDGLKVVMANGGWTAGIEGGGRLSCFLSFDGMRGVQHSPVFCHLMSMPCDVMSVSCHLTSVSCHVMSVSHHLMSVSYH